MKQLIAKARAARKHAYAPYSRFKVGAAIECADGRIFTGCNVESESYAATCCAERTAIYKAVSEGARSFKRIAIVADTKEACPPCGICRQVLIELAPKIEVIMANTHGCTLVARISDLLPNAFRAERFKRRSR